MDKKWKLLGKKTVLKTFRSSVQSWTMRLPGGRVRDFFISAGYSFVVVLAIDTKGRVVILKQYYIGQQKKLISLVAGIIDEGSQQNEVISQYIKFIQEVMRRIKATY